MKLSVRKKLLISYFLIGLPLALLVIYASYQRYDHFSLSKFFANPSEIGNIYFFALGFLLSIIFSIIAGAFITKPLSLLKQYSENFANLNFKKVKPIKSGDEFEVIFNKFNEMNKSLKKYIKSFNDKNKQLETIISNMQSGVIICDTEGQIVTMNKAAKQFFGWCKCTGKNQSFCLPFLKTLDGQDIEKDYSPFDRPLGGEKYSNYLLEAQSPDGKRIIFNFNGRPLKSDRDKIYGAIVTFLDVSEQYRLQERLRRMVNYEKVKANHLSILHEISLHLNKEKDVSKILNTVLKAAVTITEAKKGLIIKKNKNGFYVDEMFTSSNGETKETKINLKTLKKLIDQNRFQDLKSIRIADFSKFTKQTISSQERIKALISIPILGENKTNATGFLILISKKNGRRFSLEDEKVTQILSAHATVAIANAKSYKREHHIAQVLQKSLLPSQNFAKSMIPNVDMSLAYKPATIGTMVGGDFYDFFEIDKNKAAYLIADVNGKGVEAAAITSLAKSTIKAFAYDGFSPDKVLEKTNKVLYNQTEPGVFITTIFGLLDLSNGLFEYANAGHHPPLVYRDKNNGVVTLNQGSTPLGILPNESYVLHIIDLNPNDCLALYTDGIIEARKNSTLYGEDNLIKSFLSNAHLQDTAQKMLADVEQFAEGKITDDIALVTLRLKSKVEQSFEKTVSLWS